MTSRCVQINILSTDSRTGGGIGLGGVTIIDEDTIAMQCFFVIASLFEEDGRNIRVDPSNATVCIQDFGKLCVLCIFTQLTAQYWDSF